MDIRTGLLGKPQDYGSTDIQPLPQSHEIQCTVDGSEGAGDLSDSLAVVVATVESVRNFIFGESKLITENPPRNYLSAFNEKEVKILKSLSGAPFSREQMQLICDIISDSRKPFVTRVDDQTNTTEDGRSILATKQDTILYDGQNITILQVAQQAVKALIIHLDELNQTPTTQEILRNAWRLPIEICRNNPCSTLFVICMAVITTARACSF